MQLKIKMKLNEMQEIETVFDEPSLQDCVLKAGALLAFDGKCAFCDSKNIRLQTRVTKEKGFKYTEFVCECGAKRQFGEYKEGGFFLKGWEPPYKKEGNGVAK